ncbi:MAG: hypothetical protein HY360_00465 [Verrucomicrobia bacterium]|nr:hypothetical protein [Verrucomicrobiota bacterium]
MRFISRFFSKGKRDYVGILKAMRGMALDPNNPLHDFDVDFWFTQPCFAGIGKQEGISDADYIERVMDLAGEINREMKRPCLALHIAGELDSSSLWPYRLNTRKEAAEYWKRWNGNLHREVYAARAAKNPGPNAWRNLENPTPDLFAFYHLKQRDIKQDPLYACCSRAWSVHQYYEWGIGTVECEANCMTPWNLQLQIAFLRGAARQYDGYWGLDFSPHGGALHLGQKDEESWTFYTREGYRAGISAGALLRQWVSAFMSGAHRLLEESSYGTHFMYDFEDLQGGDISGIGVDAANEQGYALRAQAAGNVSPVGKNAGIFADFALRRHRDRGRPYVPFGIIIEHDHGWNSLAARRNEEGEDVGGALVPDSWPPVIWGGSIAPEPGDHAITNFFRAAFSAWPSFYWTPGKWSPGKGAKMLCQKKHYGAYWDKSNEEAVAAVLEGKLPIENLEQDLFQGGSRWGDSFDVVIENCPLDVLKDFKVLILLGRVKLTGDLLGRIKQYVAEGGTLVVNVLQLDADSEQWLGLKAAGRINRADTSKDLRSGTVFEERPFSYTLCNADGAEVEAETNAGDGLIYRMPKGQGEVFLTTAHYLQADDALATEEEGMESRMLHIGIHLIERLYQKVRIVAIEGPAIESIVTRTEKSVKITLINNYQTPWSGGLSWKNDSSPPIVRHNAFDCWRDESLPVTNHGGAYATRVEIEPFGIRVVEVT